MKGGLSEESVVWDVKDLLTGYGPSAREWYEEAHLLPPLRLAVLSRKHEGPTAYGPLARLDSPDPSVLGARTAAPSAPIPPFGVRRQEFGIEPPV